jgi:hypothetical protein
VAGPVAATPAGSPAAEPGGVGALRAGRLPRQQGRPFRHRERPHAVRFPDRPAPRSWPRRTPASRAGCAARTPPGSAASLPTAPAGPGPPCGRSAGPARRRAGRPGSAGPAPRRAAHRLDLGPGDRLVQGDGGQDLHRRPRQPARGRQHRRERPGEVRGGAERPAVPGLDEHHAAAGSVTLQGGQHAGGVERVRQQCPQHGRGHRLRAGEDVGLGQAQDARGHGRVQVQVCSRVHRCIFLRIITPHGPRSTPRPGPGPLTAAATPRVPAW